MKRISLIVAAVVVAALSAFFLTGARDTGVTGIATLNVPAPTTAAGYTRMFAQVDPNQWGGADVSISVPMSATRSVWLYGDTLSGYHGMVNSTAITQDGGTLHVSQGGNRLLPQADNDSQGRKVVYWIEAAHKVGPNTISVTAGPTWVSNSGQSGMGWGRHTAKSRTGLLHVDANGDVTFERWTGWTQEVKNGNGWLGTKDGAPFEKEGVVWYGKESHPEAHLASGKTLVTICRNSLTPARHADGSTDYTAYRPVYLEQ